MVGTPGCLQSREQPLGLTISDIKNEISLVENVCFAHQKIIIAGKIYENNQIIWSEITNYSTIDLVVSVYGGAYVKNEITPEVHDLWRKDYENKKVCRKCYATLAPRAKNCRKKKCGHYSDLRMRHPCASHGRERFG